MPSSLLPTRWRIDGQIVTGMPLKWLTLEHPRENQSEWWMTLQCWHSTSRLRLHESAWYIISALDGAHHQDDEKLRGETALLSVYVCRTDRRMDGWLTNERFQVNIIERADCRGSSRHRRHRRRRFRVRITDSCGDFNARQIIKVTNLLMDPIHVPLARIVSSASSPASPSPPPPSDAEPFSWRAADNWCNFVLENMID